MNMRKTLKRVLSLVLLLCLVAAQFPTVHAVAQYDAAAAVAYADAHWDDGVGLCAEFVSKCLAAGGIQVPNEAYYRSSDVSYLGQTLGTYVNPYYATAAQLKWLSTYFTVIESPSCSDMELGDIVFMSNSVGRADGHVVIITGFDGNMPLYSAHNNDRHNAPINSYATFLVKMRNGTAAEPEDKIESDSCGCSDSYAGYYICATQDSPLTIRSGHGTSYAKVGSIPKGATVYVTKAGGSGSDDWGHVEYNGVSGYACMKYLSKLDYYDVTDYRTGGTYTCPTRDGYVFAGWFADAAYTQPLDESVTSGYAYAKFVDADVHGVKWQFTAGTNESSASTSIRLVTTVDSLGYRNVGFEIRMGSGKVTTQYTSTVYQKIQGKGGEEIFSYEPVVFSPESVYFATCSIVGVPNSAFDTQLTVTAIWVTHDGTVVKGQAKTFCVSDYV